MKGKLAAHPPPPYNSRSSTRRNDGPHMPDSTRPSEKQAGDSEPTMLSYATPKPTVPSVRLAWWAMACAAPASSGWRSYLP